MLFFEYAATQGSISNVLFDAFPKIF